MFRMVVGLAFLTAGLAAIAASIHCGSRASVADDAGLRSPVVLQALLMQLHPKEEHKARHTYNVKAVHPSGVQSGEDLGRAQGYRAFQGTEELAAMQAKWKQASEADKLANRQARNREVAVQSVYSALHNRKTTLGKSQAKVIELEAAAAVEAEEATQKADKQQVNIDKLQTDFEVEGARLIKTSDPVTHLQKSVREAFQDLSGSVEAQPLISQLGTAFTGLSSLLAAATPTPPATDARDDIDVQPDLDRAISVDAVARAFENSLEGLPEDERGAQKQKFEEYVEQERRVQPPQAQHDLLRLQPAGCHRQGTDALIPC